MQMHHHGYEISSLLADCFPWEVLASLAPMEVFKAIIMVHMLAVARSIVAGAVDTTTATGGTAADRLGAAADDKVKVAAASSWLLHFASDSGRLGSLQMGEASFHLEVRQSHKN